MEFRSTLRNVRVFSITFLLLICSCRSHPAGQGLVLRPGEAVLYEGFGNYAWSRGRVELWLSPRWDSRATAKRVLFQTNSRDCNTEIGFEAGRYYLRIQGQVKSTAPQLDFNPGDWLYLVGNYDFPGQAFQLFVNGKAGSAEHAALKEPDADWAGVPFKLYTGGLPQSPAAGEFAIAAIRTGNRPLTAQEVEADYDLLHRSEQMNPDANTLLLARFNAGIVTERGYGLPKIERRAEEQPSYLTYQSTPVPPLDQILGPVGSVDSWLISDATWKAHPGTAAGEKWSGYDFNDGAWQMAVALPSQVGEDAARLYLHNDKPHHLGTSRGVWIDFGQGHEGVLRRTFAISAADKAALNGAPGTFYITSAEKFDCFINGHRVGSNGAHFRPGYGNNPEVITQWQIPQTFNIAAFIREGKNVIAVRLRHDPKVASEERHGLFVDWRKGKFNSVEFDWPSLSGAELLRPATLDLREPVLHALEYHFNTDFKGTLVEKGGIFYGWSYGDTMGRSLEALVFLRAMTGIQSFPDVDRRLMELTLQTFTHPDGMSYRELGVVIPPQLELPGSLPYACMWDQAEVMFGLVTWYEKTRSALLQKRIEEMIKGLTDASVKARDAYHVPQEFWDGRQWVDVPIWFNPGAVLLDPVAHYYEISGSPAALSLLKGLYQSQKEHLGRGNHVEHYFDEDFRLRTLKISGEGQGSENFGAGISLGWLGALRTALILHDQEMVDWISRGYDWAIGNAATRYGHVLEGLGHTPGEICGAVDMVETAVLLAEHKDPKYWNYVEWFIRNQILQTQDPKTGMWGRVTAEGTMSSPLPCCSSRGVRGMYIAWHHTVTKKPEGVFVNLAFNRDSPWLEVVSYLPYQGRIDLNIHDAPRVFVRIPDWATQEQVKVERAGRPLAIAGWQNNFAILDGLKPGEKVTLRFPIHDRDSVEQFRLTPDQPPVQFKVRWRGYTVLSVSPNGKYNRTSMDTSEVPMRKVKSYAQPDREIDW